MSNMNYCRFENTTEDLQDCLDALENAGGIAKVEQGANEYERPYIRRLLRLCIQIADDYRDELDALKTSGKE